MTPLDEDIAAILADIDANTATLVDDLKQSPEAIQRIIDELEQLPLPFGNLPATPVADGNVTATQNVLEPGHGNGNGNHCHPATPLPATRCHHVATNPTPKRGEP